MLVESGTRSTPPTGLSPERTYRLPPDAIRPRRGTPDTPSGRRRDGAHSSWTNRQILTIILPVLSPRNRPMKASAAFSTPSTTVSS